MLERRKIWTEQDHIKRYSQAQKRGLEVLQGTGGHSDGGSGTYRVRGG